MRSGCLILLGACFVAAGVGASPWQPFTALAVSPDGRTAATGGMGGEVLFWELSTGEVQGRWTLEGAPVAGLWFASGVSLGAALLDGRGYQLPPEGAPVPLNALAPPWEPLGNAVRRWTTEGAPMSGVRAVFGDRTAEGDPDGRIFIRVAGESSRLLAWQAHSAAVTGLVWAENGAVLVSCSYDGSLSRWDSKTGKLLSRL